MAKTKPLEPCKVMCKTCPWRDGSPYAYLQDHLAHSALTEANRICHSTGGKNGINPKGTGKPAKVFRGARDLQLRYFTSLGLLKEPTDAEWSRALTRLKTP